MKSESQGDFTLAVIVFLASIVGIIWSASNDLTAGIVLSALACLISFAAIAWYLFFPSSMVVIVVKDGDAAIVLSRDGKARMYIPEPGEDGEAHANVALIAGISVSMMDDDFCNEMIAKVARGVREMQEHEAHNRSNS